MARQADVRRIADALYTNWCAFLDNIPIFEII